MTLRQHAPSDRAPPGQPDPTEKMRDLEGDDIATGPCNDFADGARMHQWARDLFPICRSLTGPGVRQTLDYIAAVLPGLSRHRIASGETVFDWQVPDEWTIRSARLTGPDGETIADFAHSNLHVVGYSEPVDMELSLAELDKHLHSVPAQPTAIPYVTSYYKRRWGFCLEHNRRQLMKEGTYRATIDSDLVPGFMDYADLVIPGAVEKEILISTYICHPSMGNNELSGPVVAMALAQWVMAQPRHHTFRFVFAPETIGAIVYISRNLSALKRNTVAGFIVTCVGDDRTYSYLPSRNGDTLADRAARHVLALRAPDHIQYTFLDRGSDERQYCSPGVDLPVALVMRSKFGAYPEYHTSLDDLNLITPSGLQGGYDALRECLETLEANCVPCATVLCEPQMGKRGLYPTLSIKDISDNVRLMMNLLTYSDGKRDLIAIAEILKVSVMQLAPIVERLKEADLITTTKP